MDICFDRANLRRLIENFRGLCGVRLRLLRADGRELCAIEGAPPRCAGCRARCLPDGVDPIYRCAGGARCAARAVSVGFGGAPLAWLAAGPLPEARGAEFEAALAGALADLAEYVQLRGLIQIAGEGDLQRLDRFLREHYTEKLSLDSISAQLHISRTRLCALAKQLSGGGTLFSLISRRRIELAKVLLARGDSPISAVAEAVGVSDYNYFSKIFRRIVGLSPSEFRKRSRGELDSSMEIVKRSDTL